MAALSHVRATFAGGSWADASSAVGCVGTDATGAGDADTSDGSCAPAGPCDLPPASASLAIASALVACALRCFLAFSLARFFWRLISAAWAFAAEAASTSVARGAGLAGATCAPAALSRARAAARSAPDAASAMISLTKSGSLRSVSSGESIMPLLAARKSIRPSGSSPPQACSRSSRSSTLSSLSPRASHDLNSSASSGGGAENLSVARAPPKPSPSPPLPPPRLRPPPRAERRSRALPKASSSSDE